ncbi:hypothetical protein BDW67DRAFT_175341 [Aspergillus spinulosporus]
MKIFRKLRGKASRSRHGSEPAPLAPATLAESESVNPFPPPRAQHISEVKRLPALLSSIHKTGSGMQSITVMVASAKGAADYLRLYRLLQRETNYGSEFDPTDDFDTDYLCDGYIYNVRFISAQGPNGSWATCPALLTIMQHVCLVLTYDALSRESWDELVAVCEGLRSRSETGVLSPYPFLGTMIVAMGEGEGEGEEGPMSVSQEEAEAFATQQNCLFVRVSSRSGRGICDAVGSLVERAYSARGQYSTDQEGELQRYRRAQVLAALLSQ